jgi:hypothetical protein
MKEQVLKDKEEAALAKKMQEMQVNAKYKPPQTYMENQSNDPAFFNYQYQKYQQQIQNEAVATEYDKY